MPRSSRLVALAAALGLVLTACGGGGGSKTENGGAKGPSAAANDVNTVAREKVAAGGTLRWPLTDMPPNFNYNQIDGTLRDTSDVTSALMPSLFNFDADGIPMLDKDYLESAELTAKDPKQVVTYKVNPKAVWSDGTPVGAADFEAHWKANSGADPAYKLSSKNGYEQIESVAKGADDREVVVTFKLPYADWKGLFSPLYPASTNNDPKVFNEGWLGRIPVTAGPFKFESLDETAKTITVVRDDKWWGDPAKLDRIVFRVIPADAQVDALVNGEIDFMDIGQDPQGRRPPVPPYHHQRDGRDPEGPESPSGAGHGHQPRPDRQDAARPTRGGGQAAPEPHLHGQPEGLQGQRRRVVEPRR
jgi:peptide/nickel transport system substrate-binding protein